MINFVNCIIKQLILIVIFLFQVGIGIARARTISDYVKFNNWQITNDELERIFPICPHHRFFKVTNTDVKGIQRCYGFSGRNCVPVCSVSDDERRRAVYQCISFLLMTLRTIYFYMCPFLLWVVSK